MDPRWIEIGIEAARETLYTLPGYATGCQLSLYGHWKYFSYFYSKTFSSEFVYKIVKF